MGSGSAAWTATGVQKQSETPESPITTERYDTTDGLFKLEFWIQRKEGTLLQGKKLSNSQPSTVVSQRMFHDEQHVGQSFGAETLFL